LGAQPVAAIKAGDVEALRAALTADPSLANSRPDGQRTLLHVLTDWPGHFPRAVETLAVLLEAGADVNAQFIGEHTERPLHWAASADDVILIDGLLDAGAELEARGGVIGGGTALDDAWGFGQWNAARRLVERGARPTLSDPERLAREGGATDLAEWVAALPG
jgi:hypothetical protein